MLPIESAFTSQRQQPLRVLNADLNDRLTRVISVWNLLIKMGLNPYWQDLRLGQSERPLILISTPNDTLRSRCPLIRLRIDIDTRERYFVGTLLDVDIRWPCVH
jgi:hypothetical protein